MTMRGQRAEGVLVVSAYRVRKRKGATAEPHTAYMDQLCDTMKKGDIGLNPRKKISDDLEKIVNEK